MAHTILGQGNSNLFADIHQVSEGKLFNYGIKTRFPVEERKRIISCLINLVNERANPEIRNFGIHGLSLILNDTGTASNFQVLDNVSADDILVEISEMLSIEKDIEVIDTAVNHLSEQMK